MCIQESSMVVLPQVLLIHLKRGSDPQGRRCRKNSAPVEFPESFPASLLRGGKQPEVANCRYVLAGVACHHGTNLALGHYDAYVRSAADDEDYVWYHCDDSRVRRTTVQHIRAATTGAAYVLLYQCDSLPGAGGGGGPGASTDTAAGKEGEGAMAGVPVADESRTVRDPVGAPRAGIADPGGNF